MRAAFAAADVSAGITATVAPVGVEELLAVADSALYAAKRAGRDRRSCWFTRPARPAP